MVHELPIPLSMKACRAPIPLDFKHPVSTNIIPAGLFKALASGSSNNGTGNSASAVKESKKRACRIMHSRLSSCEIFEHAPRPSLNDLCIYAISQNASWGQLITDPGTFVRRVAPALQALAQRESATEVLPALETPQHGTLSTPKHTCEHPYLDLPRYAESTYTCVLFFASCLCNSSYMPAKQLPRSSPSLPHASSGMTSLLMLFSERTSHQ